MDSTKPAAIARPALQELQDTIAKYAWLGVLLFSLGWVARLAKFVAEHALNCLFADDWDYLTPIFHHADALTVFRWQHGPHREGIGLLFEWAVLALTRWDTRVVDYAMVGLIGLALLVALWLRFRLTGRLLWSDVLLPLLFCSYRSWESLFMGCMVSPMVMPLLIIMLCAAAWRMPSLPWCYAAVVLLNLFAVYTGYGLFLGLVNLFLLGCIAWKDRGTKAMRASLPAFGLALLTDLSFFWGYSYLPVPGGSHSLWQYLEFDALLFAYFFNAPAWVGGALMVFTLLACSYHLHRWLATGKQESQLIFFLSAFTLLYALNCAVGRVVNGLQYAQTSRYLLLLVPGMVALYLAALAIPRVSWRIAGIAALFIPAYLAQQLPIKDEIVIATWNGARARWSVYYKQTGNVRQAEHMASFTIDPHPEVSQMDAKLAYLKARRLNLFAP
ncbi:MAG TPA: hypothetical protein VKT32_09290 [Chthonomonadaceae bacterium]|nr:hypothetical protein [Chthonomonadaceae bacterium]